MRTDLAEHAEHDRQAATWLPWHVIRGNERDLRFARRDLAGLAFAVSRCRHCRVAVQAGGNVGVFPIFLARFFETVLTFEPDPYTFRLLCDNVARARAADFVMPGIVMPFGLALGADEREARLIRGRRDGTPARQSGVHHVQLADDDDDVPAGSVGVTVRRLDNVATLPALDLLYLDIEGFELFALEGAKQSILQHRPVIGVEINKSLDALKLSPADVVEYVVELGYKPAGVVESDRIFVPREWD